MSKRKRARSKRRGVDPSAAALAPSQLVPNQKLTTQRRKVMQQHYRAKYKLG